MMNPLRASFVPSRSRIGRLDYLFSWVVSWAVLIGLGIVALIVLSMVFLSGSSAQQADAQMRASVPIVTFLLIMLPSIYCGSVLGVRRLHDMGRSGWWIALYYALQIANIVASLYGSALDDTLFALFVIATLLLIVVPGTKDKNVHGPIPPKF